VAPTGTATPAGTVHAVGASPEGIVYDPNTNLVAVAVHNPDRLLLLDPATLAVVRSVPLPGSARHLQLAAPGGPVLAPAESADELVEVTLPGGATSAVGVGKQPHDAAASGGDVVVGNEFGRSLSIIRNGAVLKTLAGVQQPGGVIADGSTVAVVDVASFTVDTFDLTTLRRTAVAHAGQGPTHGVLVSGQRLVVADTRGNAILVFSVRPLKQLAHLAVPGTPYGTAFDATTDTVWVTLTALNEVIGLDVRGTVPVVVARYPTVRQPNTVAVAPGSHTLWITGTDTGVVERISR
jgi:DNA-binding beta-propeller fold protein YncE